MNIHRNINRLLLAINYQGRQVKYEAKTFYSEKAQNYITLYILYEKRIVVNRNNEAVPKWIEVWQGYKKQLLLQYLIKLYKEGEAIEKV